VGEIFIFHFIVYSTLIFATFFSVVIGGMVGVIDFYCFSTSALFGCCCCFGDLFSPSE
jgi:hypothetical protein